MHQKVEIVKFAAKCRDIDRQYENNNNSKLDNGVYNKFAYNSPNGGDSESSNASRYMVAGGTNSSRHKEVKPGDSVDGSFK
jgi:hypothetical protein